MNKKDISVIFMGTPQIAASCLEQLIKDGYNVSCVFTREDKPVGRKMAMTQPPVKVLALANGIPVYQPKTLKGDGCELIKKLAPDLIVVVAYGRLLPKEVIDVPKLGCINLHVSLLPKYRGAAPIQWSLINGDEQTGVSVMYIDEGLDTGDIIDVLPIAISKDETQEELFLDVEEKGKVFLSRICKKILDGTAERREQDDAQASLAPQLTKDMALFTFDSDAITLHNKIRGQNPWPGTYFVTDGKKVKVLKARVSEQRGTVGEILSAKPLIIACKQHALELVIVQPEGSKAMEGFAFALGRHYKIGDIILQETVTQML